MRGQKNYVKVESGPLPLGGSGTFSVLRATLSRCTVVIDEDTSDWSMASISGVWGDRLYTRPHVRGRRALRTKNPVHKTIGNLTLPYLQVPAEVRRC